MPYMQDGLLYARWKVTPTNENKCGSGSIIWLFWITESATTILNGMKAYMQLCMSHYSTSPHSYSQLFVCT